MQRSRCLSSGCSTVQAARQGCHVVCVWIQSTSSSYYLYNYSVILPTVPSLPDDTFRSGFPTKFCLHLVFDEY